MTSDSSNRRPIAVRRMALFHHLARWLQVRGVTPNMVSIARVIFSIIGGTALAITDVRARNVALYERIGAISLRCISPLLPRRAAFVF